MAEIEFKLDDKKVRAWLEGLAKRKGQIVERDNVYIGLVSVEVYRDVIRHFEQEKGPNGPWQQWSPSYRAAVEGRVAFRKIGGRTVPITGEALERSGIKPPRSSGQKLQDTGALRQQFRTGNWRKVSAGVEWYNPAKTKTGFPYAAAHDNGGPQLPQRQFMWLSDSAMDKLSELTLQFLTSD